MNKKHYAGCLLSLIAIFVTSPMYYWLLYSILERVEATELMWFIFWAYVPITILVSIFLKIIEYMLKD